MYLRLAPLPAPTAEPQFAESAIRQFIGWLSVDIPELNKVVIPDLADSWERFKLRMGYASVPPEPQGTGDQP